MFFVSFLEPMIRHSCAEKQAAEFILLQKSSAA
jgi:hypothetical protein